MRLMSKATGIALRSSILLVVLILAAPSARAELPRGAQRAADRYLAELRRVENSGAHTSMESLFVHARSLDYYFFGPDSTTSIEDLSEAEQDSLRTALRGLYIFIGDYVFTHLNDEFFQKLADTKGLPQDREFLKAYAGRYLGSEQIQDCTHFGANLLVNQHGAWQRFRTRYPRDYADYVAEEDADVMENLFSPCACGDSVSVDSELRNFVHQFPQDPMTPKVRGHLASLRNGTSGIKFNCPPPRYH